MKQIVSLILVLFLLSVPVGNGQITTTGSSSGGYAGQASGVAPAFLGVGYPVMAYKTGVDFKATGATTIFTVPTGRTFFAQRATYLITAVSGAASGITFSASIISSSGSAQMLGPNNPGSITPAVNALWGGTNASGSIYVTCAAPNSVQVNVITGYSTSTSVTGTVVVYGFYSG